MRSKRMQAIASFLEEKEKYVADIGTDHAYIPIFLLTQQVCEFVYCCDKKTNPLHRAKKNMERFGLEEKSEIVLSDGAKALRNKRIDVAILSGMGGKNIKDMMKQDLIFFKRCKYLILQPQSCVYELRKFLHNVGFMIDREDFIKEKNHYYTILRVKTKKEHYEKECFYAFGKCLLENKNKQMKEYLLKKQLQLRQFSHPRLQTQLGLVNEALTYF